MRFETRCFTDLKPIGARNDPKRPPAILFAFPGNADPVCMVEFGKAVVTLSVLAPTIQPWPYAFNRPDEPRPVCTDVSRIVSLPYPKAQMPRSHEDLERDIEAQAARVLALIDDSIGVTQMRRITALQLAVNLAAFATRTTVSLPLIATPWVPASDPQTDDPARALLDITLEGRPAYHRKATALGPSHTIENHSFDKNASAHAMAERARATAAEIRALAPEKADTILAIVDRLIAARAAKDTQP